MAECIPSTHIIRSWAEQNLGYKKALAELVDNALDAEATRVSIEFHGSSKHRSMRCTDDGRGAPDVGAMVKLGEHHEHPGTRSGRYGVGGKDAVLWIGGAESSLSIKTVHAGKLARLSIDWRDLLRIGAWKYDDPTVVPATAEDGRGTSIIVERISRQLPSPTDWAHVINELGYIFAPALKRGVQIAIGRDGKQAQPVQKWIPPKLEELLVRELHVGARTAKLTIGMIASGETTSKRGVTYFLEGTRVVQEAGGRGCGDYSIAHVCGYVELDRSWPLTKNKDALVGGEQLYAAVLEAARPVLEKARQKTMHASSERLRLGVEAAINKAIGEANAKAKRRKKRNLGVTRPKPAKPGSPHARAEVEQPGSTFKGGSDCGSPPASGAGGCIQIDFADSFAGPSPIGEFDEPTHRVTMNTNNPWVRQAHDEPNELAMTALVATVLAVQEVGGRQLKMFRDPIEEADAPKRCLNRLGTLLSETFALDGAPIVSAAAAE